MGTYINKGNGAFTDIRNDEYVDKSGLIAVINRTLNTERRFSCVTRCRRFGKSMAAKMLCAYYDQSCHSHELFQDLEISKDDTFEKHLNQYPVIAIDITSFTTQYRKNPDIVDLLQADIKMELAEIYSDVKISEKDDLMAALIKITASTKQKFILIMDEWDAILREFENVPETKDAFVDLMRRLFKGQDSVDVFAGAYITGILPIKKYNTESALNNFREYSMVKPGNLAPYLGFTKDEVKNLCLKHNANFDLMRQWYDGYCIGNEKSMFNPYSVIEAIYNDNYISYWSSTGAYDRVSHYIQMNFEGLKDDIINMLGGGKCAVKTSKFENDFTAVKSKDDVLTVLIHLGYLSYDSESGKCNVPNKEVAAELTNAVESTNWKEIVKVIEKSEALLEATLRGDEELVAQGIDLAHDENTSILSYNDENSLSCVISIAYIYARNNYIFHREYATGKGYADIVLIPRNNIKSPALVIELKYNQTANTAIDQIKQKQYADKLAEYSGEVMLVGISYDKETKTHTCKIEQMVK